MLPARTGCAHTDKLEVETKDPCPGRAETANTQEGRTLLPRPVSLEGPCGQNLAGSQPDRPPVQTPRQAYTVGVETQLSTRGHGYMEETGQAAGAPH